MRRIKIDIRPEFYFGICISFLLLPLRLTLAWFTAALIHELGHYIAIRLTGTQVSRICVGMGGAEMDVEAMSWGQELLCSLAGPVSGFLLLFLIRWLPILAVCGCLQSLYNLLPIFPLDGGRICRCILKKSHLPENVYLIVENTVFILLALGALYLTFRLLLGPLPLIIVAILFAKVKLSCKQRTQAVQ